MRSTQLARKRKALLGVVPADSPFYRFHPLSRLVGLLVLAVVPLFVHIPEVHLLFLTLISGLFVWGRVDVRQLRRYGPLVITVACFMFLVSILAPSRRSDETILRISGFTLYYESLRWTFVSYLRILAMLFATILYFSTNHESDTLIALRSAHLPFAISYVVGLSLRAAALFLEDFHTIRQAEKARGLDTTSLSLRDQTKLYSMYLIPLFVIALRRAEEISAALFARGYTLSGLPPHGGPRPDYILSRYRFRLRDWAICLGLVVFLFAMAYLQFGLHLFDIERSAFDRFIYSLVQNRR
jgi:energy-coupling factor transporter transmembrane protein EcfT